MFWMGNTSKKSFKMLLALQLIDLCLVISITKFVLVTCFKVRSMAVMASFGVVLEVSFMKLP